MDVDAAAAAARVVHGMVCVGAGRWSGARGGGSGGGGVGSDGRGGWGGEGAGAETVGEGGVAA